MDAFGTKNDKPKYSKKTIWLTNSKLFTTGSLQNCPILKE